MLAPIGGKMNRRKFIAAAVGAAVIPQLPVAKPLVIQENYSIFDIVPVGQPLFPNLVLEQGQEYRTYLINTIAIAFDVPRKFLVTK